MQPQEREYVYIQSFKHDGSLHRTWAQGYVIESNDKRIVAVTNLSVKQMEESGLQENQQFVSFIQINGIT